MSKLFSKTINGCHECPNMGWDQNITRCECKAKNNAFICWDDNYGTDEDEKPYPPIPSWCPLPNKEKTLVLKDLDEEELCTRCKQNLATEPHPCPFAHEINGDDTPCTCCEACTDLCADEI